MGKASRAKKARSSARSKAKAVAPKLLDTSATKALAKVPDRFSHAVFELNASLVNLRGNETKQQLEDGRLYVRCDSMALVPLQEYRALIEIAERANAKQLELINQIKALRDEAKKRESLIVIPGRAT